MPLITLYSNI